MRVGDSMTKVRLSHSQANTFNSCNQAWYFHYRDRLRKKTITSALLFGSLIDVAVETYLETGSKEEGLKTLKEKWEMQEINNVPRELFSCTDLVYSNSDFDKDLLLEEDWTLLKELHGDDAHEEFKKVVKLKGGIGFQYLKKEQKIILNNFNWLSMLRKGNLMFDKVIQILDEQVTEVLGTQVKIELENDEEDSIIGYTDFIVRLKGYDKPVILDLKTSSITYEEDSVKTSQQLSIYLTALSEHYEDTRLAGYLVLHKRVKKNKTKICKTCGHDGSGGRFKTCNNEVDGSRCNGEWDEVIEFDINYQLIVDEITEHVTDMVMENMDAVANSIKSGVITRSFENCMKAWGPCQFRDLCYKKSMEGLITLEEKDG